MTREEIVFFEDYGYLIKPDFIQGWECDFLIKEADKVADGHYSNLLNLHKKSELFFNTITNKEIINESIELLGSRMIPIGSIYFFCKPDNPLELGSNFHQDNYAAKAKVGSYLAIGLALDDADESNGALNVYKGSHKLGDLDSIPSKNFEFGSSGKVIKAFPIGNKTVIPDGMSPTCINYSKGSLIFLHSNIIHGSPRNPSKEKWRRTFYMHYIKDGHAFWPGWNARRQIIDIGVPFKENNI